MKKFIVPVLSVCFFISCSTDDTALNTVETTTTDSASDIIITEKSLINAANAANPFDYVGELHKEILEDYLQKYETQTTIPVVVNNVDAIAVHNTEFTSIDENYPGLPSAAVEWTMENIDNLENIMDKAELSVNGKLVMNDLIELMDALETQSPANVISSVKAFESSVMSNESLSGTDMQVILSAASIARYSTEYYTSGPRKWIKTKNGVTASASTNTLSEAITMSVTADLLTD